MTPKVKDVIGKAASLLALAPTFVEGDARIRNREAAATLAVLGVTPDPAAIAAAVEAAELLIRPAVQEPLLARVKAVTGWSDRRLAPVLGMTRASVQAYASSRIPERLTEGQTQILLANLKARRVKLDALIVEMER